MDITILAEELEELVGALALPVSPDLVGRVSEITSSNTYLEVGEEGVSRDLRWALVNSCGRRGDPIVAIPVAIELLPGAAEEPRGNYWLDGYDHPSFDPRHCHRVVVVGYQLPVEAVASLFRDLPRFLREVKEWDAEYASTLQGLKSECLAAMVEARIEVHRGWWATAEEEAEKI